MQGLQRFRCSHNRLPTAGVPWATLSLLPRLSHLQAASNCLTLLDPVLCQASSLRLLDLSGNSLESLPADIGQLQNLEELDVCDNKLRRLPDSLGMPFSFYPCEMSRAWRGCERVSPEQPATCYVYLTLVFLDVSQNILPGLHRHPRSKCHAYVGGCSV